jgi:HEAT repeat protein
MKRPAVITLVLLLLTLCAGCQRKGHPQYGGKPLRYWEAQSADKDPEKKLEAIHALGKIGPKGLPALVKLLPDDNRRVHDAAILVVIRMGPAALPELKRLIRHSDEKVRAGASKAIIQVLVDMGHQGFADLVELLKAPEPNLRAEAAKALIRVGPGEAIPAIPALKELLADEDPGVRRAATASLRTLAAEKHARQKQSPP